MISTSTKYKQQLIAGNRNYVVKVNMTLADNTTLLLTNEHLWEQGVVISNGISDEDSFQIGSAIIGSLTLIIDNIKGNYNGYDFLDARLTLWLGVEGDTDLNDDQVYYRIGFYVVDNTTFNGSLITLSCLDNMTWFDVPFSDVAGITYPCTAGELVADICAHVGVTLGIAHFPNYTTTIPAEPDGDNNCREILSYVAQKCCCYCKINTAGQLILGWYDKTAITGLTNYDGGTFNTTTTPYSDGCNLDGGSFMSGGDNADGGTFSALQNGVWLTQNFDMSVGTDDIVVTGCRVRKTSGDDIYDELWTDAILELDHPRYVLVIENNPFITSTDAATTANTIGSILAGLPIRGFSSRSLSDFSYETGDMVTILDFRGNIYYTWITNLTFTINNAENFSCGVESLKERGETRYSEAAKTLAEAQQNANKMLTDYDRAVQDMNELAQNAIGYNKYEGAIDGRTVTWLYNGFSYDITNPSNPIFADSTVVFKISGDGVFISHDGGTTYDSGYDANSGTAILSLLYTVGLTSDWIKTGTLDVGGLNNEDGVIRVSNRVTSTSATIDNTDVYKWLYIGPSQIDRSGSYKVFYDITNVEAGKTEKIQCQIQKRDLWGGSTYTYKVVVDTFDITSHSGELPIRFDVDASNANIYYAIKFTRVLATNAAFTVTTSYNKVNTVIDRNGVDTTMLTADGGEIAGYTINDPVNGNGLFCNRGNIYAEYSVNKMHIGAKVNNSYWTFCATANGGEFLHLDYGGSNVGGIWITNNGANNIWDFSGGAMHITKSSVSCDAHGEVVWSGSDRKLKKNIRKLTLKKAKDLIFSVIPREFEMKAREGKRYGFIAQELRETLSDDSGIEFESNGIKNINYNDFIAPLCMIVKKQQEEIDLLKKEVALLKEKVGS